MTGPGTPNNANNANPANQNAQQPNQQQTWRGGGRIVARGQPRLPRYRRPPTFRGRMPNERVVWIRRQSRWFLLVSAAPLLLGLLGVLLLHLFLGNSQPLPQIVVAAIVGLLILRWLVTDFYNWIFTYYFLTSERVVKVQGFFQRTTGEVVLKNVSQVIVDRPNFLYVALNLGNVQVRPLAAALDLPGLATPRDVADSILALQENPNYGVIGAPTTAAGGAAAPAAAAGAATAVDAGGPRLKSQKMQGRLDELAQPLPMPLVRPITRGQWLQFLARRIPIKFFEGEQVVEVVYRHWALLLVQELIAIAVLVASLTIGILLRRAGEQGALPLFLMFGGTIIALIVGYLTYLNWADDVFVLTTHRVIDVDRLFFILEEYSNDAPYARIQEVNVERGFIGLLLGFGSIEVQTSGRRSSLKMEHIPNAGRVMDHIFQQINLLRERESVAAINKQKKENYKWLSTLFNEALTQVPDVRGLGLLEAASQLRKAGLKMVVLEERHMPGTASGTVVEQRPSADASALTDSEVQVVLAAQSGPAAAGGGAANPPAAPPPAAPAPPGP